MVKKHITCDIENYIAILQIDNPPANELSSKVINELSNTLDLLAERKDVKVIIITGKGRFFCTGVDINEIAEIKSTEDSQEFRLRGRRLVNKMLNSQKPLIAAINNVCLGGGLELAMACHIRVATVNARLGLPEITFGILPGFGGIRLLKGLVGRGKAIEMILTGEKVLAKDIKEFGLVNHVVSGNKLIPETKAIAEAIAEKGFIAASSALRMTMHDCIKGFEKEPKAESTVFDKIYETEDWRERVSEFLEKRKT
ncbi:MAG: putative enoyl-CoA hydratase [Candidatus Scalindua arabica]|uniref:Enoyl-CoA hydratase n=1 Tax=Candidatus Scalindua arabica TaxID=1127984 RepID=A0A941W569_9BACT|nr:putative enoyl-CoA hydratase [Candidatus Scalindua arabica]